MLLSAKKEIAYLARLHRLVFQTIKFKA